MKLSYMFLIIAMCMAIAGAGYFSDLNKPGTCISLSIIAVCLGMTGLLWWLSEPYKKPSNKTKHNDQYQ